MSDKEDDIIYDIKVCCGGKIAAFLFLFWFSIRLRKKKIIRERARRELRKIIQNRQLDETRLQLSASFIKKKNFYVREKRKRNRTKHRIAINEIR